jgi:predicted methyltransferase
MRTFKVKLKKPTSKKEIEKRKKQDKKANKWETDKKTFKIKAKTDIQARQKDVDQGIWYPNRKNI